MLLLFLRGIEANVHDFLRVIFWRVVFIGRYLAADAMEVPFEVQTSVAAFTNRCSWLYICKRYRSFFDLEAI